jgi:hypothetical protein
MTDYSARTHRCYCCGKNSEHSVLVSSNSFGSPDLDQRPPEMFRSTIQSWLQECPDCGYVAPNIEKGDASACTFLDTSEFRAAALEPALDPDVRRFLVRAAYDAYVEDRRSAFQHTLAAAWVADDRKQTAEASELRLRAAKYLAGGNIRSIDLRLRLLDALRRASNWTAAEALIVELVAERLEYPFAEIIAFHRSKIAAGDPGRYTIEQALDGKREPITF